MAPPTFRPRFRPQDVRKWATLYDYPGEGELIAGPVKSARVRGYLTRPEFLAIAEWKSARPRRRYESNSSEFVEEVTRIALAPETSPRLAVEVLMLLAGVRWPTASVFLHFCHPQPYPIIDFRALWSLSVDVPDRYTFEYWAAYCDFVREFAAKASADMRTVDRALWKYSQLHQDAV